MDPESIKGDPPLTNITLKQDQRSLICRSERDLDHEVSVDPSTGTAWSKAIGGDDELIAETRIPSGEEKVSRSEPVELMISRWSIVKPIDRILKGILDERLWRLEVTRVTTRSEERSGTVASWWWSNGDQVLDGVH